MPKSKVSRQVHVPTLALMRGLAAMASPNIPNRVSWAEDDNLS